MAHTMHACNFQSSLRAHSSAHHSLKPFIRTVRSRTTCSASSATAQCVHKMMSLTRGLQRGGVLRPQKAFVGQRKPPKMQSLFGVGAPEAILVGVVALIVFGPKGLAEAARSVGKLLRSFQPTIKEVVEVSRDLQSTLQQELGLDELKAAARGQQLPPTPRPLDPTPASQTASPSVSPNVPSNLTAVDEETAKLVDPDIEAKRAAAAAMAWGAPSPQPAPAPAPATKDLAQMTVEELEAELARRKATTGAAASADSTSKA